MFKEISLRNTNRKIEKLQKQLNVIQENQNAFFELLENIKNEDIRQHTFLQKTICLLFDHKEMGEKLEELEKRMNS